ncbi:c6 transcription factor [Trichoderma arundinaceum]|uniref:C6 transcription factor n=1 Tax=Trichoderma arundinaceum TaxID=490622 RepID=A0A395NGC9_TRIAR|nr:c6 transcription factor [Trichoderma arundinaceum]
MSKPIKSNLMTEAPTLPPLSVGANNHPVPPAGSHADPSKSPAPASNGPQNVPPGPKPNRPPEDHQHHHQTPRHRFLTPAEWGIVAHGIGGIRDREQQTPIHPTSWLWPPKGMPRGLYKDTVTQRTKFFYLYHASSGIRWILMLLQLFIGATLTALGSMSFKQGTPITILGAANTVIAGLLAFLQNSGLPDRYRYDKSEFEALEDHIKEILDSGIAPADQATDQILAECFDLYQDAKSTVSANLPANYMSRIAQQAGQRPATLTQSGSHPAMSKQLALPYAGGDVIGPLASGK